MGRTVIRNQIPQASENIRHTVGFEWGSTRAIRLWQSYQRTYFDLHCEQELAQCLKSSFAQPFWELLYTEPLAIDGDFEKYSDELDARLALLQEYVRRSR